MNADELYEVARGILDLGERQRVRLFLRTDRYERFVSCLVYLPRDRFNTANRRADRRDPHRGARRRVGRLGAAADRVGARAHPLHAAASRPGSCTTSTCGELEARIVEATRSWDDDLQAVLTEETRRGDRDGALPPLRRNAFPAAYREDLLARSAIADVQRIEALDGDDALDLSLYRPLEARAGRAALQALPARRARVAVRRAADVRVARADGHRRAAVRGDAARRRRPRGSTTSGWSRRRTSTSTRSASASTTGSRACGTARPSSTASTG